MQNKIALFLAISTLPLIQLFSSAQDAPNPSNFTKTYEIRGFSMFENSKISGRFTVNNSNNDELIDKSKLSYFKLI